MKDLFEQIQNLIDLKDSGAISKEDFNEMLLILKNEHELDNEPEINKEKSTDKTKQYSEKPLFNPIPKINSKINIWLILLNAFFLLSIMSFFTGCPSFLWNRNQVTAPVNTNQVQDFDQDGIADNEDQCPSESGSLFTNGCPDADGDNVPDREDFCKDIVGDPSNQGCPIKFDTVKVPAPPKKDNKPPRKDRDRLDRENKKESTGGGSPIPTRSIPDRPVKREMTETELK
jgi:hypothetical protein